MGSPVTMAELELLSGLKQRETSHHDLGWKRKHT